MNWWRRLLRRARMEQQLDKELRFHLEQHADDLIAGGADPAEARRQARIALGGKEQVKEQCRDARGTRWVEDFWQDLRYALRTLGQKPGFAAVALITLALGIGATTVMFTVVSGVLLKPLPYRDPGGLLAVQEQTNWSTRMGNLWAFTNPNYLDCRREARSLDMEAWRFAFGTISQPGEAESVGGREISAGLLPMLGVTPVRGRSFMKSEDRLGAAPVAMIGYGLWQRRFGGSASAIGSALVFDGVSYSVVGVLPPGFRLGLDDADVFTLL